MALTIGAVAVALAAPPTVAAVPVAKPAKTIRKGVPTKVVRSAGRSVGQSAARPAGGLPSSAAGRPASRSAGRAPAPATADDIPRPGDGDPDKVRIERLQSALTEVLSGKIFGRLKVGMRVIQARTGRLYFGRRSDALMDPASNQKLLATTAALMRLGSGWRFQTVLTGALPDGEGVIAGPVYLRGSGDPTLRIADLDELAERLRARGVVRVDGGVVADMRRLGDSRSAGDSDETDQERAPLNVNRAMILVRVGPGPYEGDPAIVVTDPPMATEDGPRPAVVIRNQARTRGRGRARLTVRVSAVAGQLEVQVGGRIPAGSASLAFRRRVPRPALHAALLMRVALRNAGIEVRGGASTGVTPASAPIALSEVHDSAPLSTILRRINKDSDNEQAERVLEAVGAEVKGGGATTQKGIDVLREVIASLGLKSSSFVPKNGSGLGHANRISANAIAELLRALYFDPRVGPDILQSMSVGGVDGTTRNRFKGTLAAHRVRAKTGTLNGKSCLSGFVGDGDDVVVFSIMVQGFRGRALPAVRAAQVTAVNAIMRYVREGTGERVDLPPTGEPEPGQQDYESGEELIETDGAPTTDPSPSS